jgi:hypothetical protein
VVTATAPASGTTEVPLAEGIELSVSEVALDHNLVADHFNFAQLDNVWVSINVSAMPSDTTIVKLTFTTPTGQVFYSGTVGYTPQSEPLAVNVSHSPHPITVFPAKHTRGGFALRYVVPVIGSAMGRYPIPGRWRVEAAIQGGRTLTKDISVSYSG